MESDPKHGDRAFVTVRRPEHGSKQRNTALFQPRRGRRVRPLLHPESENARAMRNATLA
jgi:hypothetical protein